MARKLTTEEFVARANLTHGSRYDYSCAEYKGALVKVKIICPEHGVFEQRPNDHLRGQGCPKCGLKKISERLKKSPEEFITEVNRIHNDYYNYSEINYKNNETKIKIICPEHGEFWQRPGDHLQGNGCPFCAKRKKTKEYFIKECHEIHKHKYDYSLVEYKNNRTPVKIICPEHGIFEQTPNMHISRKTGCPKCARICRINKRKCTTKEFIKKAQEIHRGKYKYTLTNYKKALSSVEIICPIHGSFFQIANDHLNGHGCPKCSSGGFNPGQAAILYYFKDLETNLYKIGITNNSLEERFGKAFCSKRAMILLEQTYENGMQAYLAEQEILEAFAPYRCTNGSWPQEKGGKTEFFKWNILGL